MSAYGFSIALLKTIQEWRNASQFAAWFATSQSRFSPPRGDGLGDCVIGSLMSSAPVNPDDCRNLSP